VVIPLAAIGGGIAWAVIVIKKRRKGPAKRKG